MQYLEVTEDNFERAIAETVAMVNAGEGLVTNYNLTPERQTEFETRIENHLLAAGVAPKRTNMTIAGKDRVAAFKEAVENSDIIVTEMPENTIVLTDDNFHASLQDAISDFEAGKPVFTDVTDLSPDLRAVLQACMEDAASNKGGELDHEMRLVLDTGSTREDVAEYLKPIWEPHQDATLRETIDAVAEPINEGAQDTEFRTVGDDVDAEFREAAGRIVQAELDDYNLTSEVNAEMFGSALYTMLKMRPEWNTRHHITDFLNDVLRTHARQVVAVIDPSEKKLQALREEYFGEPTIPLDLDTLDEEEADAAFAEIASENTLDARDWAIAFLGVLARDSTDVLDEGLLIAWFANAIEQARTDGREKASKALLPSLEGARDSMKLMLAGRVKDRAALAEMRTAIEESRELVARAAGLLRQNGIDASAIDPQTSPFSWSQGGKPLGPTGAVGNPGVTGIPGKPLRYTVERLGNDVKVAIGEKGEDGVVDFPLAALLSLEPK